MPQAVSTSDPMRLLRMDREHQSGGVREAVLPGCYYGQASEVKAHQEEVKECLRRRLKHLKRRRLGLSTEPSIFFSKDSTKTSQMPTRVESPRIHCLCQDEDMQSMWPSRDLPVQGRPEDHQHGGCERAEEVRTAPEPQSVSLKSGIRKRILGELNQRIQWLESQTSHSEEYHCDKKLLEQIFHLRLLGEVYSPERFAEKAGQHKLEPGRAYDLVLGHQLLDPNVRRQCLKHFMD